MWGGDPGNEGDDLKWGGWYLFTDYDFFCHQTNLCYVVFITLHRVVTIIITLPQSSIIIKCFHHAAHKNSSTKV